MAFYEYSIYGKKKSDLKEVADTLIKVFDFDPTTLSLDRSYRTPWGKVTRTLRLCLGVRDEHDWHLFLTGPKLITNEHQMGNLLDKYGAYTDGGGYDFTYDPTVNYPDDRIARYQQQYDLDQDRLDREYRASLTPEERAEHDKRHAEMEKTLADLAKYGYAE